MLRACVEPVCVRQPPPTFPNSWPSMLRSTMARVAFSYRLCGENFVPFGKTFLCPPGRWVGAQVGIYYQRLMAMQPDILQEVGWADFEWFSFRHDPSC